MVSGGNRKRKNKKNDGIPYDPMAVTWAERYPNSIAKVWNKIPENIAKILATVAIFTVGISINGNWVNIFVHAGKQFGFFSRDLNPTTSFLQKMEGFWGFFFWSSVVSYILYFGIGGFIHWYFYVRQRDHPEEWKCQPKKWLPPDLERHEILVGSLTLFTNATISAFLSCYIYNGGYSTVYYNVSDHGWLWLILQIPIIFLYQDYVTYWLHRMYHFPFLYKHFHKLHHKYKQPTAFSVTAIHPIESCHIQLTLVLPLFVIPVHWVAFYSVALYVYYHGIIDHSGVNFKAYWWQPWQPDAIFHDNHHQYFHVNFAFNISYWDKLHGTYRQKDRVYTEDIFYGKGKKIDEVSKEELKADLRERESENPLAYRQNKMEFELSKRDLAAINRKK